MAIKRDAKSMVGERVTILYITITHGDQGKRKMD